MTVWTPQEWSRRVSAAADRAAAQQFRMVEDLCGRVDVLEQQRGLDAALAERLKAACDPDLVAEVEQATDAEIVMLNRAASTAVDFARTMRSVEQTIRSAHGEMEQLQPTIATAGYDPPCEHRDSIDIEDFSMEPPALAPVITVTGRLCIHCQAHLPLPDEENPQ